MSVAASQQTKRPPSHIVSIIIFSLSVVIGAAYVYVCYVKDSFTFLLLVVPVIFLIGLVGVINAKKWSRIYCSIVYLFFAFAYIFTAIKLDPKTPFYVILIISAAVFTCLALWLCYALAFGKKSLDYFQSRNR